MITLAGWVEQDRRLERFNLLEREARRGKGNALLLWNTPSRCTLQTVEHSQALNKTKASRIEICYWTVTNYTKNSI
jgi:hypothetical protein